MLNDVKSSSFCKSSLTTGLLQGKKVSISKLFWQFFIHRDSELWWEGSQYAKNWIQTHISCVDNMDQCLEEHVSTARLHFCLSKKINQSQMLIHVYVGYSC